ncbi:MAG: Wzz/FepE/Etk N-terminal domain-containing protein, partial [Pseudomonadota bacterium]
MPQDFAEQRNNSQRSPMMSTQRTPRLSLRDILYVIFKRRSLILVFFLGTVATLFLGSFILKPTYEATAKLLFKSGREDVGLYPREGLSSAIRFDREEQINSEIEILRSRSLMEETILALGPTTLYPDLARVSKDGSGKPVEPHFALEQALLRFENALRVKGIQKSSLIEATFSHADPTIAAEVVNTICNLFLERHLQVHTVSDGYEFFQRQLKIAEQKLQESQKRLEQFKAQNGVSALEEQTRLLLDQTARLETELNETLGRQAEIDNRIAELKNQLKITPAIIPQSEELEHNPYIVST